MPYPIPSWLQSPAAPNPADEYTRGLALGANIQQQANALATQSNEAQVRAQIGMQENERNFQYQQQQASIQNAIQQQELQMRQQELAMHKQQNEIAVRNAADRFSAEQELSRRVSAGEELGQVMLQLYPRLYRGASGAGLGTLMNAMRRNKYEAPKITELEYGGKKFPGVMNPNTGAWSALQAAQPGRVSESDRQELTYLRSKAARLEKYLMDNFQFGEIAKRDPNNPQGQNYMKILRAFKKVEGDIEDIRGAGRRSGGGAQFKYDPKTGGFDPVDNAADTLDFLDEQDANPSGS